MSKVYVLLLPVGEPGSPVPFPSHHLRLLKQCSLPASGHSPSLTFPDAHAHTSAHAMFFSLVIQVQPTFEGLPQIQSPPTSEKTNSLENPTYSARSDFSLVGAASHIQSTLPI